MWPRNLIWYIIILLREWRQIGSPASMLISSWTRSKVQYLIDIFKAKIVMVFVFSFVIEKKKEQRILCKIQNLLFDLIYFGWNLPQ